MCWSWHGGVGGSCRCRVLLPAVVVVVFAAGCFRRWLFHRLGRSLRGAQELRASAPGGLRPARAPGAAGGCCGGVRCREAAGVRDFGGAAELVVVAGGRCVRPLESAGASEWDGRRRPENGRAHGRRKSAGARCRGECRCRKIGCGDRLRFGIKCVSLSSYRSETMQGMKNSDSQRSQSQPPGAARRRRLRHGDVRNTMSAACARPIPALRSTMPSRTSRAN